MPLVWRPAQLRWAAPSVIRSVGCATCWFSVSIALCMESFAPPRGLQVMGKRGIPHCRLGRRGLKEGGETYV